MLKETKQYSSVNLHAYNTIYIYLHFLANIYDMQYVSTDGTVQAMSVMPLK